jgi:hypothetical protein
VTSRINVTVLLKSSQYFVAWSLLDLVTTYRHSTVHAKYSLDFFFFTCVFINILVPHKLPPSHIPQQIHNASVHNAQILYTPQRKVNAHILYFQEHMIRFLLQKNVSKIILCLTVWRSVNTTTATQIPTITGKIHLWWDKELRCSLR